MLEGITVLNQAEIIDTPHVGLNIIAALIILVVSALFSAPFKFELWTAPVGFILGSLVVIGLIKLFNIPMIEPSGRYRYECTIDESVSMTEVYERYDIIEQRGDIWVLEDKEVE